MTRTAALLSLLLLLACGPTDPAAVTEPETEAAPAARAVEMDEEGEALRFRYAWPAEAAAIPALNARLRAEADTFRQQALEAAQEDRASRLEHGFPFHPHQLIKTWDVEGDTPAVLALRGEFYEFTGGAHGMSGFEAILWDRARDRAVATTDLFRDPKAALALLETAFCPALNAERAERRGAPVPSPAGPDDWMNTCPELGSQVLIPSGVADGAFTAMRVLIGPYGAGPYAEGAYDILLPLTPALVALAQPDYAGVMAAPAD